MHSRTVIGASFLVMLRLKMSIGRYWLSHTSVKYVVVSKHLLSTNPEEYTPLLIGLDLLITNILGVSGYKWNSKDYNLKTKCFNDLPHNTEKILHSRSFWNLGINRWKKMLTGTWSTGKLSSECSVLAYPDLTNSCYYRRQFRECKNIWCTCQDNAGKWSLLDFANYDHSEVEAQLFTCKLNRQILEIYKLG